MQKPGPASCLPAQSHGQAGPEKRLWAEEGSAPGRGLAHSSGADQGWKEPRPAWACVQGDRTLDLPWRQGTAPHRSHPVPGWPHCRRTPSPFPTASVTEGTGRAGKSVLATSTSSLQTKQASTPASPGTCCHCIFCASVSSSIQQRKGDQQQDYCLKIKWETCVKCLARGHP